VSVTLLHGDCLVEMDGLADNSVDAVITDPPAGIAFMGKRWDNLTDYKPKSERAHQVWLALEQLVTLGALQGWEAGFLLFTVDWATRALRVQKPGGPALVWSLPRTSDLTQMGLRMAGYEIRDVIAHLFGSGFPKSADISKMIDKAAGAEREVIGKYAPTNGSGKGFRSGKYCGAQGVGEITKAAHITAPATPAAQLWDGWGTALKPAREDWILAMKPREGTFAENALRWGVAGIWVEGGKIPVEGGTLTYTSTGVVGAGRERACNLVDRGDGKTPDGRDLAMAIERQRRYRENAYETTVTGRWPANLILDEEAAALLDEMSGERRSSHGGGIRRSGKSLYGIPGDDGGRSQQYYDTGGASRYFMRVASDTELDLLFWRAKAIIEAWNLSYGGIPCQQPSNASSAEKSLSLSSQSVVSALNDAVIAVSLGDKHVSDVRGLSTNVTESEYGRLLMTLTTAILSSESEVLRVPPPGKLTPNGCLVSIAETQKQIDITTITISHWKSDGSADVATFSIMPVSPDRGEADFPSRVCYCPKASQAERTHNGEVENVHPTCKPIALMRYLVRLLRTPTGGVFLDPFMGSGSTILACIREDVDAIGIERDADYFGIAQRRINKELATPYQMSLV
jgi:site-specific DNA-methyltransferase (adenine-specific)